MRIAVQMDPIDNVDIKADTTFALIREALARGHKVATFHPDALILRGDRVCAIVRPLTAVREIQGDHGVQGEPAEVSLHDVDVVLIRQDPPFDMAYLTTTWLLERLTPDVLVVNDPRAVRDRPEKLFAMGFPELMPETLVTRDVAAIKAFRDRYRDIVVKPLFLAGGAGVFRVRDGDDNFNAILETLLGGAREPVIAQRYLPAVREGDKRVILIEGEAVGAINRIPADDDARSNMHAGGRAAPHEVDAQDRKIAAAIGPALRENGVVLAGIDVIGGLLTEINITSPTGVQELKRFSGVDAAALFWDAVQTRRMA